MGWIGVDLDGTLAVYPPESGALIGDAIPGMAERVRKWHKDDIEVRIFTVRAGSRAGVKQVKAWLKANELPDLMVTNVKDSGMVELWDDRAIRVIRNTGSVCAGCNGTSQFHHHSGDFTNC
ncbi:hypothetical protein O7N56_003798 [Salmonella enterica]|uniref:Uncharacterized protein n=4 Tax=Enterobacteriaceae TaxID=543 RepID=A0A6Y1D911_SALET|nr:MULTISPECIES: hypothetical protein [Enterobacteriaceae]EAW5500050.1 hypothetical protein [Salmonella enterica subsp. enterica serovar Liverpool]EBV6447023.1 hypothetical protein [Salmonella enterica subsp. enterica serovar Havana]ECA5381589.1 hypothetical protein [Salmonella enterica subsp. enterica serovar Isangi]ECH5814235.1 hypothetical protein [Salmonella enterica subsp. enterica serovar Thompson]EDJ9724030.1 hypothetical protein [Salmonella enterica subsp. enterica serovar Montevideo]